MMVVILPTAREFQAIRALQAAGHAISTVHGKRRMLNVVTGAARVVSMRRSSVVEAVFDFSRREQL